MSFRNATRRIWGLDFRRCSVCRHQWRLQGPRNRGCSTACLGVSAGAGTQHPFLEAVAELVDGQFLFQAYYRSNPAVCAACAHVTQREQLS